MFYKVFIGLLVAGAGGLFAISAQAQSKSQTEKKPISSIRQPEASVGTRLRKVSVDQFGFPINYGWHELTAEQRDMVRAEYEDMPDTDEPPFPVDGMIAILEPLRRVQQEFAEVGEIYLIAMIDPVGKVESVEVLKTPDRKMAKIMGQIINVTKFKPAVCGGQPCRMEYPLRMVLSVEY